MPIRLTLPIMVPLLGFEPRDLLLLRETTLPICPQGHGADGGDRTHDLSLTKGVRFHCATSALVVMEGFEPPIFRV